MENRHTAVELDTALMRILASFAVVMLHISTQNNTASIFYNSLTRFSVPAFLIISGYYMLWHMRSISQMIYKTLKMMCLMLLCSSGYFIFDFLSGNIKWQTWNTLVEYLLTQPVHLWYLYATAALYIITPLLYPFVQNAGQKLYQYALCITFFFGSIITMAIRLDRWSILNIIINDKMHLPYSMGFLFLYLLGGYLRRWSVKRKTALALYVTWLASVFITFILTVRRSQLAGELDTMWFSFFSPFAILSGAAFFIFIQRQMSGKKPGKRLKKILEAVSSYTLGIYLLHNMILRICMAIWNVTTNWITIPVLTVIVYVLTAAVVFSITQIYQQFKSQLLCIKQKRK